MLVGRRTREREICVSILFRSDFNPVGKLAVRKDIDRFSSYIACGYWVPPPIHPIPPITFSPLATPTLIFPLEFLKNVHEQVRNGLWIHFCNGLKHPYWCSSTLIVSIAWSHGFRTPHIFCEYLSLLISHNTSFLSLPLQNAQLERELELLRREFEEKERELEEENSELKNEVVKLRAEMEAILKELQEIMDTKLGLELEIAAYRKLLEGEENR
jgi:hypothetical protein